MIKNNTLPKQYEKAFHIDLLNDKHEAIKVNLIAFLILLPFIGIYFYLYHQQIITLDLQTNQTGELIFQISLLIVSSWLLYVLYIFIHEGIHAIMFKLFSNDKVKFGFHGLYASASMPHSYFKKYQYLMVALAPFVIMTIIFLILLTLTQNQVFLVIYILFAFHISGCTGDIYISLKLLKFSKDTYINDYGVGMTFYTKKEKTN